MEGSSTPLPSSIWTSIHSWFTPTILFFFLNFMIATILFTSNLPNTNTNTNTNTNDNKQQNQQKTQNQNESNTNKLARSPSILNRLRSFNLQSYVSQNDQTTPILQDDTLEQAATQYVFDHPFPLDQPQDPQPIPVTPKPDLDPTREVQPISKAQTHFIHDKHTIEKVTTHFDFGPTHLEKTPENEPVHLPEKEPENFPEEESDQFQSLDEVYSNITNNGQVNRTKSDTIPSSGEVPMKLPAKMKKSASMKSPFAHFEEEKIVEARRPATVRERRREVVDGGGGDDDVEVDARADDFINKFKHQLKLQRLDSIIRYKDTVNRAGEKGNV